MSLNSQRTMDQVMMDSFTVLSNFIFSLLSVPLIVFCSLAEAYRSPGGNSVLDELELDGFGVSPDDLSEMPDRLGPLPGHPAKSCVVFCSCAAAETVFIEPSCELQESQRGHRRVPGFCSVYHHHTNTSLMCSSESQIFSGGRFG